MKTLETKYKEGVGLGVAGGLSTIHVENFLNSIRGKEKLQAPIDDPAVSMAMVQYGNVPCRIEKGDDIDTKTGKMLDQDAMKLRGMKYAKGWTPRI